MLFKGSVRQDKNVILIDNNMRHVREERRHFLLVDIRGACEAHREALVAIFAPRENDCAKFLRWIVERDGPKSHVEIESRAESKPFKSPASFVNRGQGKRSSNDVLVETSKVADKADLLVLLGYSK